MKVVHICVGETTVKVKCAAF